MPQERTYTAYLFPTRRRLVGLLAPLPTTTKMPTNIHGIYKNACFIHSTKHAWIKMKPIKFLAKLLKKDPNKPTFFGIGGVPVVPTQCWKKDAHEISLEKFLKTHGKDPNLPPLFLKAKSEKSCVLKYPIRPFSWEEHEQIQPQTPEAAFIISELNKYWEDRSFISCKRDQEHIFLLADKGLPTFTLSHTEESP